MATNTIIRNGSADDLASVLPLNQSEAHWTSDLTKATLENLVAYAIRFLVIEAGRQVIGFLIVVADDSAYPNDNLRWFKERYSNFWYVDRIVVAQDRAGSGLGKQLYEQCFDQGADAGIDHVVCEYSTVPMNHGSAAFHRAMGFAEVGIREDAAKGKRLSMQLRDLSADA